MRFSRSRKKAEAVMHAARYVVVEFDVKDIRGFRESKGRRAAWKARIKELARLVAIATDAIDPAPDDNAPKDEASD